MKIDATHIFGGLLYQGQWPMPGPGLAQAGFKTLILCAREFQPPYAIPDVISSLPGFRQPTPYPGVKVFFAPNDDDGEVPHREDLALALEAAHEVAWNLERGQKVLSTCWQGRNRSGLVSALGLHLFLGCSGQEAVGLVQTARRNALTNGAFVEVLNRLRPVRG